MRAGHIRIGIPACIEAFALVALDAGRPAGAQEFRGSIGGRVLDPSGGVIPGVNVSVTNVETGQATRLVTNESGQYAALLLVAGMYRVEAEIPVF